MIVIIDYGIDNTGSLVNIVGKVERPVVSKNFISFYYKYLIKSYI
jgi:hypothetical protein